MQSKESTVDNTYEGRQEHIRGFNLPEIEVFKNIYNDRKYTINMEIPEFTAICPKTGLPDFGTLYLTYTPDEYCLELKSLKEYITAYRDIGIFHENVTNRVLDDIVKAARPIRAKLHADYNVRGGIKTRVTVTYRRNP